MSLRLTTITETSELEALVEPWRALANAGGPGALFRGPAWLLPWWRTYRERLGAQLAVHAGWLGDRLVLLAPCYTRVARGGPGIKISEIRMMGDAGPRPPSLDLLVAPGHEEAAGNALAEALAASEPGWDVLDLEPLTDPSRARAFLVQRLQASGRRVESTEAGGALRIALAPEFLELAEPAPTDGTLHVYVDDDALLRKGLAALRRLSRLEWADRDEVSPLADAEATRLLHDVVLTLGKEGRARLVRLDDAAGEAVAVALVVDDAERAVVLALAADPEQARRGLCTRLLAAEAHAAAARGRAGLDVVTGAGDVAPPALPSSRQRALRVRVYNRSRSAALARTLGAVRRRVEAAREAPTAAAAGARAAWSKIVGAAANVAAYQRLQLYRGELWTRGIATPPGLTLATLTEEGLAALPEPERDDLLARLDLDPSGAHDKWLRGDLAILARIDGRAAGIAWCARAPVPVPELGREVRPGPLECYIHDVFVAPQARGRAVAPSMLEFCAREMRQRDVYRSWALIGHGNVASIRAFEKAAYTAVAEIIHARVGSVDRTLIRPPDPEAKKLLGLP